MVAGGGSSFYCCSGCIVCRHSSTTLLQLQWAASVALAVWWMLAGRGWWVQWLLDIGINSKSFISLLFILLLFPDLCPLPVHFVSFGIVVCQFCWVLYINQAGFFRRLMRYGCNLAYAVGGMTVVVDGVATLTNALVVSHLLSVLYFAIFH